MRELAGSPYRSAGFTPPPARGDAVEVRVAWGDELLAVALLREGEAAPRVSGAEELAGCVALRGGRCVVDVPAGGRGWLLRDEGAAPFDGRAALPPGAWAVVRCGGLTQRARVVDAPEPPARGPVARRGDLAAVALFAALLVAGRGATAEDPSLVARDDAGAAWLRARLTPPRATLPPLAPPSVEAPSIAEERLACFCAPRSPRLEDHPLWGLPWDLAYGSIGHPQARYVPSHARVRVGPAPEALRRAALRAESSFARCLRGAREVSLRVTVRPGGEVELDAPGEDPAVLRCARAVVRPWRLAPGAPFATTLRVRRSGQNLNDDPR